MRARVLAFVAAIAMVVGAVAIRNALDDDSGPDGGPAQLRLVCASELGAVCDEFASSETGVTVTVEPAAATADRLASVAVDKAPIDGWLTPGPWGDIVNAARGTTADPLFATSALALARSPLMLAVWKNRRNVLACNDAGDLGCVGDAVRARNFRLGTPADDQALGVLVDAALAVGHIRNATFATNDLSETDLSDWLTVVDASADRVGRNPGGRSFTELLTFGTAAADGYLSTEAEIQPQLATAARRGDLDVVRVGRNAATDVVFSPVAGDRGERLAAAVRSDRVREALVRNGWQAPRPGQDDGLPSAGVLLALRDLVR